MGFLEAGTPLSWNDSLQYLEYGKYTGRIVFFYFIRGQHLPWFSTSCSRFSTPNYLPNIFRTVYSLWAYDIISIVRKHGIQQFINTYNRIKHRHNDVLKWGDEVRILS